LRSVSDENENSSLRRWRPFVRGVLPASAIHAAAALAEEEVHEAAALSYPDAMIASLLLLVLFSLFALLVYWRAARIERVLQRLGDGDPAARTGLASWAPLGRLAQRVDWAAERLAEERRHLADSEGRLRIALQGCDIGVWDWQLDSGRIYYSPRWKSLLGFAEDETPGHAETWLTRVHPDDLARVTAALDEHLSGHSEIFLCEHRLRHKRGDYLWVQQSGVASRDDSGRVLRMIGALADVSAHKAAQAELLSSREAYRSVVEGVTQVILRSDGAGRLSFLNPAWQELTGHSIDESLGRTLISFVHDDERHGVSAFFAALAEGAAGDLSCELRLRCRDDAWRWFALYLRATPAAGAASAAGVLSDLTAQKASEAALLRSNRERDAILTLGPDGFVFADEQGRVSFVNPAFAAMTGLAAGLVVGRPLAELDLYIAQLGGGSPGFAEVGEGADGLLQLERPHKTVIRWLARLIPDGAGGIHGRVIYLRDITRESEVDRMKSDFLSTAAHELRTPMASIFGFSELLLSREFEPAMQRDLLERIHRQTRNLINLVNELLDLSRIEARGGKSFKMQVQEITPVVLNAVAAQYVPAPTHKLEFDWPKDLPKVRIDAEKFQQCLINVLSNAVKYSPGGGVIRVNALRRDAAEGARIGVAISDPGIGMTPEQSARIFERFYRADPSGAILGSGLGMSLVKEYMAVFGGDVEVVSAPGQGTTVVLWLPVADSLAASSGSGR
jgi:PAS domain S-box-containing protein